MTNKVNCHREDARLKQFAAEMFRGKLCAPNGRITMLGSKSFQPTFPQDNGPFGVYIHIPFCKARCPYCGFSTNLFDPGLVEGYVNSLLSEIELWAKARAIDHPYLDLEADTLYFGGGTPSLLRPESLARIIEAVRSSLQVADDPEISIEINPATVDRAALAQMRKAGINRASLGIQSLDDEELRRMGRIHTASEAVAAFTDLRATGFDNVSVDLIAGFPGQPRDSLRQTLRGVFDLRPDHISIYLLEVKAATDLETMILRGEIAPPDADLAADMYEEICAVARKHGYEQYEISNFALPDRQCRHNLKYWNDDLFLGIGAAAHGMTGSRRYSNLEDLDSYRVVLEQGRLPFSAITELTPGVRFKDALIMGLRLVRGLNLKVLGDRYQVDAPSFVQDTIGDLAGAGFYTLDGDLLTLTDRGRLLSNQIFSRWV